VNDLDKLEALTLAASPGGVLAKFDSTDQADQIRQFTENLTHGSGEVWGVVVPINGKAIDDECAYSAITGNGPTSEANAKFYSVARENTLTLIAQVRALTAELRIERGMNAMIDSEREAGPPWLADAAEALCGKNPDGSVPALNWTQVIQEIKALRVERDRLAPLESSINIGALALSDEEVVSLRHFHAARHTLCAYCEKARAVIERVLDERAAVAKYADEEF
jgi:hypothetical protein